MGVGACFVAFLVVHGALHEGKLMAPSGNSLIPILVFRVQYQGRDSLDVCLKVGVQE